MNLTNGKFLSHDTIRPYRTVRSLGAEAEHDERKYVGSYSNGIAVANADASRSKLENTYRHDKSQNKRCWPCRTRSNGDLHTPTHNIIIMLWIQAL